MVTTPIASTCSARRRFLKIPISRLHKRTIQSPETGGCLPLIAWSAPFISAANSAQIGILAGGHYRSIVVLMDLHKDLLYGPPRAGTTTFHRPRRDPDANPSKAGRPRTLPHNGPIQPTENTHAPFAQRHIRHAHTPIPNASPPPIPPSASQPIPAPSPRPAHLSPASHHPDGTEIRDERRPNRAVQVITLNHPPSPDRVAQRTSRAHPAASRRPGRPIPAQRPLSQPASAPSPLSPAQPPGPALPSPLSPAEPPGPALPSPPSPARPPGQPPGLNPSRLSYPTERSPAKRPAAPTPVRLCPGLRNHPAQAPNRAHPAKSSGSALFGPARWAVPTRRSLAVPA